MLKSAILAFSMFSALPMPRVEWNERNMRYMMCAFPLVGVVIGGLYVAVGWVVLYLQTILELSVSVYIAALCFTLIPLMVTGGIHLDGFMDTCDAFSSHAEREKKLAIMKDPHCGSFAVLGCVLYVLSYYVIMLELCRYVFVTGIEQHQFMNVCQQLRVFFYLAPIFVLSRLFSALAVAVFPIAKSSGLVHTFATASARRFTAIWCIGWILVAIALLIINYRSVGFAIAVAALVFFCCYYAVAKRNFGGITGDTAGWFLEVCELLCIASVFLCSLL